MKVQLNHPGSQKMFKLGNGYRRYGDQIIREWNNDNSHYRKFITNKGHFVTGLNDLTPKQTKLYFWGEWEGNSFFTPLPKNNFKIFPNGIHEPFHSTKIKGGQNTDPYIYGESFFYSVCKQTGKLRSLKLDDLILFGSTFTSLNKFYIDTVFVVKSHETSIMAQQNEGKNYSQTYKEATLNQLFEYFREPIIPNKNRIYISKNWWDDRKYFSFVPCKDSYENNGFERFFIKLDNPIFQLSNNPTGKSFLSKSSLNTKELWNEIVKECINQGFKLGVKIEEPKDFELNI